MSDPESPPAPADLVERFLALQFPTEWAAFVKEGK